jgi:hypothetical protein
MLDFTALEHFSRCHCVAICAVLIPVNLLMSLAVIVLSALDRSPQQRRQIAMLAWLPALLLVAHVASWWVVGVIAPASFLLPFVALLCTAINCCCLWRPTIVQQGYELLRNWLTARLKVSDYRF